MVVAVLSTDNRSPLDFSPSPPLAEIMQVTAEHIREVLAGTSLTQCLATTPDSLHGAVLAHDSYVLRQLGWAQAVCQQLVPKRPKPLLYTHLLHSLALLEAAYRWGADQAQGRAVCAQERPAEVPLYAPHTIVDQAVRAASRLRLGFHKRLINGVLRRYQRERKALLTQVATQASAVWNFPLWWVESIQQAYPQQWRSILLHSNTPAPLTLRINQRQCSVVDYLAHLKKAGIAAYSPGQETVVLHQNARVTALPGYAQGWFSVQDGHAQLAAHLLPVQDGDYVLDACAAPGGKAAHLLERHDIELVAIDADEQRLQRVHDNLQRLQLQREGVQVLVGDAAQPQQWWSGRLFDAILADVPCTASGVVRRHPDIRWLRRQSDIQATAQLQHQICTALWPLLKPGGYFLYVTCSIFPAEGEQQIQTFMQQHADARRLSAPGQLLPTPESVGQRGGDGFFYALLKKEG